MKTDKYTKFILTVIAVGLFVNAGIDIIEPAMADDSYIIKRILYCIDGSSISGGSLSTYCNG
jgi:hypothetical protein